MAIQKITADVIATSAVTTDSLSDSSITAAKLHTTLDLTGKTVTVATASAGDNDTTVASTAFVSTAIANLADSAPSTLDTLNELAAALGDDASFSTTVTNSIATKAPLASPDFTGDVTFDTSTLVVDATNNRVGIGLTNPANTLEIQHGTIGTGNGSNNTLALRYNSTTLYGQHYMDNNGIYHIRADAQGVSGGNLALGGDASVQIWTGSTPERKVTVDSSGSVSIGNTVASSMDGGANNLVIGTGSGTEGMTIYSGTANSGVIYFADGASGDDRFRGQIGYSHSDNAFSFRTNASASANMTLDSAGKVGIGTTSPADKLHVYAATGDVGITIETGEDNGAREPSLNLKSYATNANPVINFGDRIGYAGFIEYENQDDSMRFGTGTAERMRINSSGNVGIGVTSPDTKLHIDGNIRTDNYYNDTYGIGLNTTDEYVITITIGNFNSGTFFFSTHFASTSETTRRGFAKACMIGYSQSPVVGTTLVNANYNPDSSGFSVNRISSSQYELIVKHQGSYAYVSGFCRFAIDSTISFTVDSVTSRTKT